MNNHTEDRKHRPIGVLDSGVGGLSVLKVLHGMLPKEDFIYVGDTARTPYGTRPESEIRAFVAEIINWLAKQDVKQVVVACNTLTMLGIDSLQNGHSFPLVGMSKGEKLLVEASSKKKIGIMATPFTISTEAHKKAILAVDGAVDVHPVPCPRFVPLIEGERFGSEEMGDAIAEYTAPLKAAGVDAVILSCTHYPFIRKEIEAQLGSGVTVIDPAEATALDAKAVLQEQGLLNEDVRDKGCVRICCTADMARVKRLAEHMLPVEECCFEEIVL